MKIIVTTTLLTLLFLSESAFSQSQNWWRVNGNSAGSNQFLGTTNNQSLNFRTNNLDRMQILPNGQFRLNSFALGNSGLLTFDATGLLTPLLFNGTGNMVLSNNGSFVPASSFSNWTLNGNYLFVENTFVGIGTQNPSKTLTVEGDALVTGTITTTGFNVLQKIQADTIKGTIRLDVNGNLTLGEEGGYNGITSKNEELRINSRPGYDHNVVINANTNGNLGIGVTNPEEKFDLFGNARLSGDVIFSSYADSANNEDRILFVDEDGRTQAKTLDQMQQSMYVSKFCDLNDPNFVVNNPTWANGPNKIFVECPQVNIGIGTNSPVYPLDVVGKTKTSLLQIGSNTTETALITGYRAGVLNATLLSLGQINQTGEFTTMTVESFGKLSLFNAQEDGQMLQLRNENWEKDVLIFDNGGNLKIANNNRTLLFLDAQQETFFTRRIVVDQEVWPDYVFKDNYKLMPLNDVKKFIEKNGHLPNVPSEREVQENGADLGEMNRILLEKIEELTLYTISQQKEIEALKTQFNQLIGQ